MTQQEALSSLFNNAARRPVDVNLGQVPLTPTIGRMGNYNVVVSQTPRDNRALELSRALSELPQLLGQARNISAASGARQAEEISLEELQTKVKNGDVEAEGVLTWLGADKEYQEAAYKRIADANIAPTLTNISSEFDRMSHAELLKFNSPDDIKAHVQGRLVGSLDPGIMETIKGKPWMEIRHNRFMESIVPQYVQKVSASIEGRKHEFKIKEAIAALETNFLAQAGINIQDIPDSAIDQMNATLAVSQSAQYIDPNRYINNFQYALDFARSQGEAAGLNRFQIEDTLIPALTAKYNMLVEDENYSEADLVLEAMESGSLKINGRPINRSSAGMRLIQNAEARLEKSLEADEGEFDQKKVDSYQLKEITRYNDARAMSDFQTEDYEEYYRQQRADLDNSELGLSVREQLELSSFYDKEIARLRGSERIYENFSNPAKDKKKEEFHQTYETSQRTILKAGITPERARESSGLDPAEFNSMFLIEVKNQYEDVTGMVFRPETEHILFDAALQAEMSTMETYIDRPRGDLFLGSDSVNAGNVPNQTEFRQEVSETAQGFLDEALGKYFSSYAERMKAQNPPLTPEDERIIEANTLESRQIRRKELRELASGGLIGPQGVIKPVVVKPSGYSREKDTYPLGAINTTLKNSIGAREFKKNLPQARVTALIGAYTDSIDEEVLLSQAIDLESIVGQPEYDTLLKNEIESKKYVGIPLTTLYAGGREFTHMTDRKWYHFLEDGVGGKAGLRQTKSAILYNKYENFSKPEETKKRIFNLPAVVEYLQDGDERRLKNIHNSLLKGKMPLEEFIKNQADFFESFAGSLTDVQTPQQTNK